MSLLIQQAEKAVEIARSDYHHKSVEARAARAKLDAATKHLRDLQFKKMEIDMELEQEQRPMLQKIAALGG